MRLFRKWITLITCNFYFQPLWQKVFYKAVILTTASRNRQLCLPMWMEKIWGAHTPNMSVHNIRPRREEVKREIPERCDRRSPRNSGCRLLVGEVTRDK